MNVNTGNDFCRTCGCGFPPCEGELACHTWEICQEAQAPTPTTNTPKEENESPVA